MKFIGPFLLVALIAPATAQGNPSAVCRKSIGDGWTLAGWAVSSGSRDKQFLAYLTRLCQIGGCFGFCTIAGKSPLTPEQEAHRVACAASNAEKDCRPYFHSIGETYAPKPSNWRCYLTGGRACYPRDLRGQGLDIAELAMTKLACLSEVKQACESITQRQEKIARETARTCNEKVQTGCNKAYEEANWAGRYDDAIRAAFLACSQNHDIYGCEWFSFRNRDEDRKKLLEKLRESCAKERLDGSCWETARQYIADDNKAAALPLLKSICESSKSDSFIAAACSKAGKFMFEEKSTLEGERLIQKACSAHSRLPRKTWASSSQCPYSAKGPPTDNQK